MSLLYSTLITLIALLLSPLLFVAAVIDWRGMRQRIGMLSAWPADDRRPVVWFHAASVGEVAGMAGVVTAFMDARPDTRMVVSTMTRSGLERARRMIGGDTLFCLLPLDIPLITRRAFTRLKPAALVLVEGELWPSLIRAARRAGCPVALVNARMSDRSYPRNQWIKPLMRHMLVRLDVIGAQTRLDADRFIESGAAPERVTVTGNVKFDTAVSTPVTSRKQVREMLGLSEDTPVVLAGCPRPVEEEQAILHACVAVHARYPDITIIWAPRHLGRLTDVERMLADRSLSCIRRSRLDGAPAGRHTVILVDTMGELASLYAAADIAFVGATLVPLGGHNLLEPAVYGVPVLFGPHTQNVRAGAEALLRHRGGREVHNADELAAAFLDLLEHPDERRRMGQAAAEAVRSGKGALEKTMTLLMAVVGKDCSGLKTED